MIRPMTLAAAVLLASWPVDAGSAPPGPPTADVLADRLWDDGKAEFSIYTGITPRYGQPRATEMRLIVVKEDLLRDALVKSERGPLPGRTLEGVKLHMIADFRTGTYTYHQTASVFFERATMDVLKEVMSHNESCGITYVRLGPKRGRWVHETHSYWEGEADREIPLIWPRDARPRLFWDALPVSLRRWVAGGKAPFTMDVWLVPGQVSGRAPVERTRPVAARLRMSHGGAVTVPAGTFAARKLELVTASGTDTFWFEEAFPHVLLRLETSWGRRIQLQRSLRLDYWNHHMNGDEKVLAAR